MQDFLKGKRVIVVGMAQTGISLARFCAARGAHVVANDAKPIEALAKAQAALADCEVEWIVGGHPNDVFGAADLVVLSPGVPNLPAFAVAKAAGAEVIAEIELAFRYLHPGAVLIAITGTNGKSTTTALTGALCAASGRPTFCGGNLGNMPMIDAVAHPANCEGGLIVVEVAAFMLEHCNSFRPHIGILTNVTEDHLDRFGTMETYAHMKGRVWDYQQDGDIAIANAADEWSMREAASNRALTLTFDARPGATAARGACLSPDRREFVFHYGVANLPAIERLPVSDLVIVGNHNMENAMAAYLAARHAGVSREAIVEGARSYRPLPHRMELIGKKGDLWFYDDSKGTNVASVAASVRGFPRKLVLIAGGVDKGGSYVPMLEALAEVCKGLVLIGEAAPIIERAARDFGVDYVVKHAATMHEAVAAATALAGDGDAVVLSPACASYDMFDNFGHRGRVFREAVAAVGATAAS